MADFYLQLFQQKEKKIDCLDELLRPDTKTIFNEQGGPTLLERAYLYRN